MHMYRLFKIQVRFLAGNSVVYRQLRKHVMQNDFKRKMDISEMCCYHSLITPYRIYFADGPRHMKQKKMEGRVS